MSAALGSLIRRRAAALIRSVTNLVTVPRWRSYRRVRPLIAGARGLEIGGPTALFKRDGLFPVYRDAAAIDNFSPHTLWEGRIEAGETFRYDDRKAAGRQYVAEASSLDALETGAYDFVLSSHTLEHTANALHTLSEWLRVVKDDGSVILLLPHKDGTFDHRRPVTTLEHLIEDERTGTREDDLTHLEEILALHDLALDPPAGTPEQFRARSERNFENRALHHHVFDTSFAVRIFDHLGLQIVEADAEPAHHIIIAARKVDPGVAPDNARFLDAGASYRMHSPFPADHR